jgi:hypothetical protein
VQHRQNSSAGRTRAPLPDCFTPRIEMASLSAALVNLKSQEDAILRLILALAAVLVVGGVANRGRLGKEAPALAFCRRAAN